MIILLTLNQELLCSIYYQNKNSPPPGRPVISASGSPTERISDCVDYFLKPFVCKTMSYIKDTNHFLLNLNEIGKLPPNCILFTLDVIWFWFDPHGRNFLEIKECKTKPSNEMLLKKLEFALSMSNFEFNAEQFLQIFGTAIGTKLVVPSYANLVMSIFEEKYAYTYILQIFFCLFSKYFIFLIQFTFKL